MEKLVVLEQSVPPRFFFSFSFEPALAGALVPNEKWAIKKFLGRQSASKNDRPYKMKGAHVTDIFTPQLRRENVLSAGGGVT